MTSTWAPLRQCGGLLSRAAAFAAGTWLAVTAAATAAEAVDNTRAAAELETGFRDVPSSERPWVYWWWLKGNVSEASITSDLEAMKRNGIGGLLMFDARGYHEDHVVPPPSRMEFMSPEWRRMLRFALAEADRLGLEVSVNLSSCAGALKGPWEVGADAPKRLVWSATEVSGPGRVECRGADAGTGVAPGAAPTRVALLAVRRGGSASAPAAIPAPAALSDDWREVAADGAAGAVAAEVVDLSDKVAPDGRLAWDAPAGRWTVLRFAFTMMEGHEYDVDVLDPNAVAGHFERMGRTILRDAGALAGRTLTHFYSVSWEGAAPTWTAAFEKEFAARRGYALRPWLPVLAGFAVHSADESARFRRDYFRTLGDCFRDHFYGTLHDLCRKAGLRWHSESGGPWNRRLAAFEHADQLAFLGRNDMPQGEFWFRGRAMNRPAAMAAHIYGRRLAATESFTHMLQHWSAYPAALKPDADAAFCDGANHLIWHTFTASPPELGTPGSEYFAGTHFNPKVTWWPMARPFVDYLARCQFALRQGHFVADICCYTGDRPYQHWGRGTNWSGRATLSPGKGRTYDLLTTEVLCDRLAVHKGKLVLPAAGGDAKGIGAGMRYRVLVVDPDEETMPVAALRKIAAVADSGATVVLGKRRPNRAAELAGYPHCDDEVRRLASHLWGDPGAAPGTRTVGRGAVITGAAVDDVLREAGIPPDFDGPWSWIHRAADGVDAYFVAGSGNADCTFRVRGRAPEIWNAATGSMADAADWRATSDGRTVVPLSLPTNGSAFVVFRKPAGRPRWPQRGVSPSPVDATTASGATAAGAPINLTGPWIVRFERGRGAPESAVFDTLAAWDQHADPGIRHFSGRATYRCSLELTAAQAHVPARLELGEAHCIAQARVNGKDLGIVWTAPWEVDASEALKEGRNEVEIDVINLWVNRLIGDAALPPERRVTKTNVTLQSGKRTVKIYQGFGSEDPLLPSGLVGPVRVVFGNGR